MNAATSGLIDIIEPAPPAASSAHDPFIIWLIAATALLLLILWAARRYRRRCLHAAHRRLRHLQANLLNGKMSQRHAAYALAGELTQIYKFKQLHADEPPAILPGSTHADWAYLIENLDRLRYQADACLDAAAWEHLFAIAESGLRRNRLC